MVAVRYGLLNGSVAYYPRSDASSPSSPSARRRDTAPTTRYDDGPLDAAAIALFNAKLRAAVEDDADGFGAPLAASTSASALPPLPPGGFPLLVALADRIARSGRPPRRSARSSSRPSWASSRASSATSSKFSSAPPPGSIA